MVDLDRVRLCGPTAPRALIGDGDYSGHYQRPDGEMKAIWRVAVEETREMIELPWSRGAG
jgi:creatinine amidohydrolase